MTIQTVAKRETNEEIVQTNFRLPKTLMTNLKEVAQREKTSMTVIVEQGIRAKIDLLDKKQSGRETK